MIFEDESRRRWRLTQYLAGIFLFFSAVIGLIYLYGITHSINLREITHASSVVAPQPWRAGENASSTLVLPETSHDQDLVRDAEHVPAGGISLESLKIDAKPLVFAFYVQHDKDSERSFLNYNSHLNVVVPDWYFVATSSCAVTESIDERSRYLLHQSSAAIIPRLTNGDNTSWKVAELQRLLAAPASRTCLVNSVADAVRRTDSKGLNVDFEGLKLEDRDNLTRFFIELAGRLHTQNQVLTIDIPANSPAFDLVLLSKFTDAFLLMAYDQHDPTGQSGPIAARDWTERVLDLALQQIPANKLLLGSGNYGYDWNTDMPVSEAFVLKYQDVMQVARDVSLHPEMDEASSNMHFEYNDEHRQRHDVWFLDGNTYWNEYQLVRNRSLLGTGLWRLGSEDPSVWSFIGQSTSGALPTLLTLPALPASGSNDVSGLFSVSSLAQTGQVQRSYDEIGMITHARYTTLPYGNVLASVGEPINEKKLLLTIDGGSDPNVLQKIADALSRQQVPATFFFTDAQARVSSSLIEKLSKQGFVIGSQANIATNDGQRSEKDLRDELRKTQQSIVASTGHGTTIFRPIDPKNAALTDLYNVTPLPILSQSGYVIMGTDVSSRLLATTSTEGMVAMIKEAVSDKSVHTLALPGNGAAGLSAALAIEQVVPELKAQGYTFVSPEEAVKVARATLQPPASVLTRTQSWVAVTLAKIGGKQWVVVGWLFLFTNVLSLIRICFLAIFALKSKHVNTRTTDAVKQTPITVVIPAYNEQKTIRKTLSSLQQSTHKNFIAMVVNDGSTDNTAKIVERIALRDPRVRLVNKENGGKFSALNLAFREATTDIIVTIDADTILYPRTLNELIKPFEDPMVDAVCGNVEVGNIRNLLTGFQALEYITTQNFDRRAFEELNCIGVVPGATGAWRRQRVLEIGGYEGDTLVEDADVTLRLLQNKGKIVYAPEARSRTEAPATLSDLAKQRLRWSFGTYQCLRKHYKSFFHGTLGWIALPNVFFFQILYPILSPIGDLVFLWALITGHIGDVIYGYGFFLAIDFVGSILAFSLDQRPTKKLMLLIFIQRFFYRQFMYFIAFRSILAVLRGTRQGWNKLTRDGSVQYRLKKRIRPLLPKEPEVHNPFSSQV